MDQGYWVIQESILFSLDSANAVSILLFEPVVGGIIGWLWEGEITLGFWTLLGGPLMLAGAIMVTMEEYSSEVVTDTD